LPELTFSSKLHWGFSLVFTSPKKSFFYSVWPTAVQFHSLVLINFFKWTVPQGIVTEGFRIQAVAKKTMTYKLNRNMTVKLLN